MKKAVMTIKRGIALVLVTATCALSLTGCEYESFDDYLKALGIKDPLTIENSDEMIDGISSIFSLGLGSYLSRACAAAAEIQEHNENVQAVVDEIESEVDGN